jgi:polar amino acid transport system substrate-binding protein
MGIGLTKRAIAGLLVAGLASVPATGTMAQSTLEKAKSAGFIRAAIHNEPPYAYMTLEGKAAGLGPEIVTAVLARLGVTQIDWVVTPFNSLIPGLKAGRWDIVAAQQTIFPARCEQVAFAEPTNTALEGLLVKAGNPKNLHSYDDLKKDSGVMVATPSGTTELNYLHAYGVPDSRLITIANHADGAELVRSGRADAYTLEQPSGNLLLSSGKAEGLELATPFALPVVDGKKVISYGATTFRKDDTAFLQAYDKELKAFEQTPEFWAIEKKNGFTEESAKLALAMTAAERCAAK